MNVKKGSFTSPGSTGNSAVTGVGFQPKALIFWATGNPTEAWIGNAAVSVGFAVSATQRRTLGFSSTNSVGTTTTGKRMAALAISVITDTGTVRAEADLVTMDSDGFTLNWTTTTNTYVIHYLALGGTDLTNAFVGDTVSGSVTGNKAFTGVGFQPDCVLMLSTDTGGALPVATTFGTLQLSAFTSSSSGSSCFTSKHNSVGSVTGQWQKATALASTTDQAAEPNIEMEGVFTSMDADGFTLNLTTAHNDRLMYLCLKGGNYWVGQDTQKTSTGTKAKTGVGFKPSGLFMFGCNAVANASQDYTQAYFVIGGSDGTSEGCTWANDIDASNPSDVHQQTTTTKTIRHAHESPSETIDGEADTQSLDSDGYTLNWTTADATAREFNVVAFGPGPAGVSIAWTTA